MSYVFSQKWYRNKLSGLGTDAFIGPDQPWTAAKASQWITQRSRQCESGRAILMGGLTPPRWVGGKPVRVAECYATGRVKESASAGTQRVQEWCCPPITTARATKPVTQEQAELYSTVCDDKPINWPPGQSYLSHLSHWIHEEFNIPSGRCRDSGVRDGDYRLVCCTDENGLTIIVKDGKKYIQAPVISSESGFTAEQAALNTAAAAAQAVENEAVIIAAQEPQYGFFQRYGLALALGAGALGIGVVAGLVKRRRLNKADGK